MQTGEHHTCCSAHTPCTYSIPDFMIQGGDPTGTGRGGTSIYGDKVGVGLR